MVVLFERFFEIELSVEVSLVRCLRPFSWVIVFAERELQSLSNIEAKRARVGLLHIVGGSRRRRHENIVRMLSRKKGKLRCAGRAMDLFIVYKSQRLDGEVRISLIFRNVLTQAGDESSIMSLRLTVDFRMIARQQNMRDAQRYGKAAKKSETNCLPLYVSM